MLNKAQHKELLLRSLQIKKRFLTMYSKANAGHIGASISCAEILTFIYFHWMKEEDEFILSKGHAAAALYSTIAEKGWITEEDILSFYQNGTYLAGHPPANKLKGVKFATGSLGHGLGLAAGIGLAKTLKQENANIFCVSSDGEINEGSIWEAVQFINHHNLKNVIWFIDQNRLQGFGYTTDVLKPESLIKKFESFGLFAIEANGHDFDSLENARHVILNQNKPSVIVCNTIKGKNWESHENKLASHYVPFKENEFQKMIAELENGYSQLMQSL